MRGGSIRTNRSLNVQFDLVEGIEPEDHLDIAEDLYNRSAGLQNRIEKKKGGDAVEYE